MRRDHLGTEADKADLRRRARAARAGRTPDERRRAADALARVVLGAPALSGARTVACYASLEGEPGTGPLREALRRAGVRVLLPVVADGGGDRRLDWALDEGDLVPGPLGTLHPPGPRLGPPALRQGDVVVVPALLVDTAGGRLGQGGGFYDVTLAGLRRAVPVVALVHDDELVDAAVAPVPTGPLDRRVTAVATPSRWWDVDRRPDAGAPRGQARPGQAPPG